MCSDCLPQLNNSVVTGPPGPPGTPGANGIPGRDGVYGGVCAYYKFSNVTGGTSFPGVGLIKFDSANLISAIRMDIAYQDGNGNDLTAFINAISIPTSTIKALIRITSKDDESKYEFFEVTGFTAHGSGATGWGELTVVNVGASLVVSPFNPWLPADDLLFCPTLSGETAFNLLSLNAPLIGVDYPAANRGNVYRITTDSPSPEGRLGTTTSAEPSSVNGVRRVFQDDLLYCLNNTVGGSGSTIAADFFIFSSRTKGLKPYSNNNGDSSFILNSVTNDLASIVITGSSSNNFIMGTDFTMSNAISNIFNVETGSLVGGTGNFINGTNHNLVAANLNLLTGQNNSVFTAGTANLLTGGNNAVNNANYNIIGGFSNTIRDNSIFNLVTGEANLILANSNSKSNVITGSANTLTGGQRNYIGGSSNNILGTDNLVVGTNNQVLGAASSTSLSAIAAGSGNLVTMANTLNLGATIGPLSFSGQGSFQTILAPLAGSTTAVLNPNVYGQYISLSTNAFPDVSNRLTLYTSMSWDFIANIVIVQKTVGAIHANTSTVGDYVTYTISGSINNHLGTTTLHNVKFLDHRNRWIPGTTPNSLCYRSIYTKSGAASQNNDVYLIQPTVQCTTPTNSLSFDFRFPGDAEPMKDLGVLETPRFAIYLDNTDVSPATPAIGTGAATDGIMTNAITTIAAPPNPPFSGAALSTFTFKNPIVDIFDGSDANGSGYYGGMGFGALATATTDGSTGVEYVGICSGGSYDAGATMTFDTGVATGTCNMSATADHVTSVTTTNGGAGYTNGSNYPLIFTGGGGSGAAGVINVIGGVFQTATITNQGTGYTGVPTVTCTAAGAGNGAAAFTAVLKFSVLSVTITAPGLYDNTTIPTVTFAGAGVAQATGNAVLVSQSISSVGPLNGSITVTSGGKGYGISRPRVSIYDGGSLACGAGNGGTFVAEGSILISQVRYN